MLTSSGSVYVCGYTIEDPSLCVREGATVIQPEQLRHFRKLSTGVATVSSLNAGLNYLVAGVHGNSAVSHDLLIWGRSPCNIGKPPFVQVINYLVHSLNSIMPPSPVPKNCEFFLTSLIFLSSGHYLSKHNYVRTCVFIA